MLIRDIDLTGAVSESGNKSEIIALLMNDDRIVMASGMHTLNTNTKYVMVSKLYDHGDCSMLDTIKASDITAAIVMPREYGNLDEVSVTPDVWVLMHIAGWILRKTYRNIITLRGTIGSSELGMHTRTSENIGIAAFVRPEYPHYALVLTSDGKTIDGVFYRRGDGTFSLA